MPQTDFNLKIIEEFRANGGETFGPFKGRPLLLLTTTGAKSGETHTTPLCTRRTATDTSSSPAWAVPRNTLPGTST